MKSKIKYQEKLKRRRDLIKRCEEYKNQIEEEDSKLWIKVKLREIGYLILEINDELRQNKIGGKSSFKHYIRYFKNKEQEVYAE